MVAMQWQGGVLSLLDQGAYPQEEKWLTCNTWEETAQALATPAVQEEKVAAIAAAYGYAQAAIAAQDKLGTDAFQAALDQAKEQLLASRPGSRDVAAALAFVVLYNLTNINITERTRELATLKVLGFYDRETTAYVYRENVFLTLFGIVLGLVLGRFLHAWMVVTVEVDLVMFGRTAPLYAYLLAAALTVVFSVVVNIAAHFRLKKVDMVESLKTVE